MTERAENLVTDGLPAIESIKQLKARYCRYLDTKDWAAWRTIFADDFVSDTSEAGGKVIAGADDFVAFTRQALGRPTQATAHQVHTPKSSSRRQRRRVGYGRCKTSFGSGPGQPWSATAITTKPMKTSRVAGLSRAPS